MVKNLGLELSNKRLCGKCCGPLARSVMFGKSEDSERRLGRCSGDVGEGVVGERQAGGDWPAVTARRAAAAPRARAR